MGWNYRIVKRNRYYFLHEAYYNKKGQADSITAEPVGPCADTPEELIAILEQQLKDAKHYKDDILNYEDF